jgi:hypothetical protein
VKATVTARKNDTTSLLLFFLHNFFISIGTILIYVCATVLLLQNNPDLSLPLAYFLAAIGCMLAGRIYNYYEHRLSLKKLIQNLMLVTVGLVILLSAGLYVLPPMVIAVGLMVGYRAIYLLSSLEFWGLSALVFDVRQSKRIFGIIGSGDLPAKAIGALLAVLIHSSYSLYILLWVASAAFLLAFVVQSLTFRFTDIPDHHAAPKRIAHTAHPPLIERLFGGSWLVFYLCAGLVFLSAAAIFIEYSFFFNVKHKYHHQDDVMSYIGYLLSMAFGVATLIKLMLSSRVIDRFGLRSVLLLLPVLTITASVVLYFSALLTSEEIILLNMFSGLYIGFEIIRRTTFDPVFLVMFQPLFLLQRLKAHTLAKGFYEPLGIAITGVITLATYFANYHPGAESFLFITLFSAAGLYFLVKAYTHYLHELKDALNKRFFTKGDLALQKNADAIVIRNLSGKITSDVLFSVDWLAAHNPGKLSDHYELLLNHPSATVRQHTLDTLCQLGVEYDPGKLYQMAKRDESPINRKLYGRLACQETNISEDQVLAFLNSDDLHIVQGSIIGCKKSGRFPSLTARTLRYLSESDFEEDQLAALNIVKELLDPDYQPFVSQCLESDSFPLKNTAIGVAAQMPSDGFCRQFYELTKNRKYDKQAVFGLLRSGECGEPYIREILQNRQSHLIHFITIGCERFRTPATRQLLVELLRSEHLRTRSSALKALTRLDPPHGTVPGLADCLQEEFDHIHHLLGGLTEGFSNGFDASLSFEINESQKRIFYLLMLMYDARMVENAMLNIEHSSREKRANAIEILDNIIPRSEYLALHSLLAEEYSESKVSVFRRTVARNQLPEPILTYVLSRGTEKFSEWTVVRAIDEMNDSAPRQSELLIQYADHADPLIEEAFEKKIKKSLLDFSKNQIMHAQSNTVLVSPLEKVMVLKRTQLFENTPENVLSAIVPIIIEQPCELGQVLFEKGELGNCMYVIYSGSVEVFDGKTKLAHFSENDIFGELALLDAEARSATAVVAEQTLLLRLDQEDFYDLMEERSELLKSVLSILCKRIRTQNDRLRIVERQND